MALEEQYGSREVLEGRDGQSGRRVFRCDWTEVKDVAPTLGSPWPGNQYPKLLAHSIRVKGEGEQKDDDEGEPGYTTALVEVDYRYDPRSPGISGDPRITANISYDMLSNGGGRSWQSDGAPVLDDESDQAVLFPKLELHISSMVKDLNFANVGNFIGRINDSEWLGFGPETVLFVGVNADLQYDPEVSKSYIFADYQFVARGTSHNAVVRSIPQERDENGSPVYYQSRDKDRAGYIATDDPWYQAKIGRPKYIEGGATMPFWDRMNPPLYGTGNFQTLQDAMQISITGGSI